MKLFNLHDLLYNYKIIKMILMKTHIISITFLILGLTASYSQVATINNANKITNPENRKIVTYFNKGFLPKDFETEKNKFPDAYSKIVGLMMNKYHTSLYVDYFKHNLPKDNSTILDIGCGGGKFLNYLSKENNSYSLYGVDHSPEMVALSKRINRQAVTLSILS